MYVHIFFSRRIMVEVTALTDISVTPKLYKLPLSLCLVRVSLFVFLPSSAHAHFIIFLWDIKYIHE
jgi:hypothetical protein